MASQIPQTPKPPHGRERRRVFWHGVLAAVGVIGGLYFALTVYMNLNFGNGDVGSYVSYSRGQVTNGRYMNCAPEAQVTVVIDGRVETLAPAESRIWRFADRSIGFSCRSYKSSLLCKEGTEDLIAIRYPDSDVLSLKCEVLGIPSLRDRPT